MSVQMHPHLGEKAPYDGKKDLRNYPTLSNRRPNPNIGIAILHIMTSLCAPDFFLFLSFILIFQYDLS